MVYVRDPLVNVSYVKKEVRLSQHESIENVHSHSWKTDDSFVPVTHIKSHDPCKKQSIDDIQISSNLSSDSFRETKSIRSQQLGRLINTMHNNRPTKVFTHSSYNNFKQNDWNIPQENVVDHLDISSVSKSRSYVNQLNDHNHTISKRTYFEKLDHQVLDEKKRRKKQKHFNEYCCSFTTLCKILCLLSSLFIGAVIGAVIAISLIQSKVTTTTDSTIISTSSISSTTSSTTTSTPMSCSFSCLNQTWISSSSLLAKWTFDGNFLDEINNFNLTAVDNPLFVMNGYVYEAVWFSSNQYLYTSYIPLASSSFTIEGWIFPTGYPNTNDHSILGLCSNPYNNQCLHLTIRKSGSTFRFYLAFFGDNCLGNTNVQLFKWTHVAFVFDMSTYAQSIYINGIIDQICISATPLLATNTSGSLTIGYIPGIVPAYGTNFFQGYIDQLTVVNRVKPTCEILDDASLVTYFTFDTNPVLIDSGPNNLQNTEQSIATVSSGHSSQAINFNNSLSYVQISGATGLGLINQSFSISLWIRPYLLQGILVFISKTSLGTQWSIPFLGFATNGSLVGQILDMQVISISDLTTLITSIWSHIVLTWSSINGLRLYLNNNLVTSLPSATSYTASSAQNYIILGNNPQTSGTCTPGIIPLMTSFNGDMDEFRVYSRELTSDDVCALYHN